MRIKMPINKWIKVAAYDSHRVQTHMENYNDIQIDQYIYFSSEAKACLPEDANLKTNDYSKYTFVVHKR
jgi:hypothetical protein